MTDHDAEIDDEPDFDGPAEEVAQEFSEHPPAEPRTEDDAAEAAELDEADTLAVPLADLRPALEAVLMVADQPLDMTTLASAVGYPVPDVAGALTTLAREYDEQGRGFELRNVAGGWRYYAREDYSSVVEKFVIDGQQTRLTQAALETLAVVAYKQPVSRARVSAVRGVNVEGVVRTLLTRGLVEEAGTDEDTGAHLYRTTSYFLERIGVSALEDLPDLAPYLPDLADLERELEEFATNAPVSHEVLEPSSEHEPADDEG